MSAFGSDPDGSGDQTRHIIDFGSTLELINLKVETHKISLLRLQESSSRPFRAFSKLLHCSSLLKARGGLRV